jgi:hypothetical protein
MLQQVDAPKITSSQFDDSRRFNYTYLGARLYRQNLPLWIHDAIRTRPSLVVGSTGFGKTELLLSIAFQDIMKGRFTIFIDGKCDEDTRKKLYWYATKVCKRPFYSLMPYVEGGHLSSSWNPFTCTTLGISKISEMFISAYAAPAKGGAGTGGGDGQYYLEMQRGSFSSLMRTLASSGYAYSTQDIRILFENYSILSNLGRVVKNSGIQHFADLMRRIAQEGEKQHQKTMSRFVNHLRLFQAWMLNSYNPVIQLDRMMMTDAVVYVGLPVNSEPEAMMTVGNIMVNQLKAISAHVQTTEKSRRRAISCIIDEAGSFVDEGLAEWICKVRSSGFLLMLGIQNLANLEGRRPGFAEEIRANSPNIMMFNPRDPDSARWFSILAGQESLRQATASVEGVEGGETGGSVRNVETSRVPIDALLRLRTGQFFYSAPEPMERPVLLASSYLPDPPNNPEAEVKRCDRRPPPEFGGLYLPIQNLDVMAQVGAERLAGGVKQGGKGR